MKYYHIDAFTSEAFKGNSAGVVLCKGSDLSDSDKQSLAAELKHSETAFVTISKDRIGLRWFTPLREVDLCGHATVAAAFALWDSGEVAKSQIINFDTRSGILTAGFVDGKIELDFPQLFVEECPPNERLNEILGITPLYTAKNDRRYLVEIESPVVLRNLDPDFELLKQVELGAFMITCRSDRAGSDFLSRFFAPYVGINEDPVTGSAHCYLAPYWSRKLGKTKLTGFQESHRTGIVECELIESGRVLLRGSAKKLFSGDLDI